MILQYIFIIQKNLKIIGERNLTIIILYILNFGSGKGGFIAKLASENLNINYIAIDMVEAMLGLANRAITNEYKEKDLKLDNILLVRQNIDYIDKMLGKKDKIDRIYVNFCNPWPRGKHNKRRLTHYSKLKMYTNFLTKNGEIYFKTDDDDLFNDTNRYLEEENFKIIDSTVDLGVKDIFNPNIETEHERMFKNANLKIKALIARGGKND